jgi:hypothetical protein
MTFEMLDDRVGQAQDLSGPADGIGNHAANTFAAASLPQGRSIVTPPSGLAPASFMIAGVH